MEIKLIEGVFTIEEAEALLTAIFKTKIAFHEHRIKAIREAKADTLHSEKKIRELENTLSDAIKKIRKKGQTHTSLNAHIEVNTMKKLTQ